MYLTTVLLTLLPLTFTLSSPTSPTHKKPSKQIHPFYNGFTMISARSASPVHLLELVATNYGFYLDAESSQYCPSPPITDCSSFTNETVVSCTKQDGSATACSMSTDVPGGQRIYVDPKTGALGFTVPHSAEVPTGAMLSGFEYKANREEGDGIGQFGFCGKGAVGQSFMACPTTEESAPSAWQVFASVKGANTTGCLGIDVLTSGTNETAWEYT